MGVDFGGEKAYDYIMIKVDEDFLKEMGLSEMPAQYKTAFLEHTQRELEMRIGRRMSEGMSLEQLREFEGIMQKDEEIMEKFLETLGDFQADEVYNKLLAQKNGVANADFMSEYLSIKWIQQNRPDYREVTNEEWEGLKREIAMNRERILAV